MSFEVILTYHSNQDVYATWPKSSEKNLNLLGTKRAFKMKQKAFFSIFKGLSIKEITQNFFGKLESDFT